MSRHTPARHTGCVYDVAHGLVAGSFVRRSSSSNRASCRSSRRCFSVVRHPIKARQCWSNRSSWGPGRGFVGSHGRLILFHRFAHIARSVLFVVVVSLGDGAQVFDRPPEDQSFIRHGGRWD